MKKKQLTIGVIGSGVAGLTAAYILDREHRVTILEKNDYIGGHTHTIAVNRGPDRDVPVDTGFIVMNHRTYPLLTRLFDLLGVQLRDSDMSFGYYCERSGLQYSSRGFNGFFADRSNLTSPAHYRMLFDLLRFHREATADLLGHRLSVQTLREYLKSRNYSDVFIDHHIIPMGAAVWSTRFDVMMDFPASTFVRFLYNHGLMGFRNRPQWRTVVGGSNVYVRRILESFRGDVITSCPVKSVTRTQAGATVSFAGGKKKSFDCVVIATHADEALKLLADPSREEKKLLGPWSYERNQTVLHTDESVMPPLRRAWASWNFTRENAGTGKGPLSLTYHMNHLQGLDTEYQYFVSLNRARPIDKKDIVASMEYTHPQYTFDSAATQESLPGLNGARNTYFCGSYFGYGFHEDAARSGVAVARLFGMDL